MGSAAISRTWVHRTYRPRRYGSQARLRYRSSVIWQWSVRVRSRTPTQLPASPTEALNPGPMYTHKIVLTQGGTHKRRSVATAGVMSLKGATGKAVHTTGGAHKRRFVATRGVMLFQGPQVTGKVVHTQGGAYTKGGTHKRWSIATAGVMLLKGPQARWFVATCY